VARECIFCGGAPVTTEHILSRKWIASLMPSTQSFTTNLTRIDDGGETFARTFKSKAGSGDSGSHPVSCVCGPCNSGWMQDLDLRLREALTAMVLGNPGSLSVAGCRLFAIWAAKIALLIDELWEAVIPLDTKRVFGATKEPPETWSFWIAARDTTDDRSHLRAVTLGPDPSTNHVEAAVFTFRVLHLIVQVLAPIDAVALARSTVVAPYVTCVWPRQAAIRWPPPEELRVPDDEFENQLEQAVYARRSH
jgi:hypothetical protein